MNKITIDKYKQHYIGVCILILKIVIHQACIYEYVKYTKQQQKNIKKEEKARAVLLICIDKKTCKNFFYVQWMSVHFYYKNKYNTHI